MGPSHVDAVEIDPVINESGASIIPIGRTTTRVTIHLDDGRSFLRRTDELRPDHLRPGRFAGAALGLFQLRLESFLFTEQAFRDVKAKLKPGGVFAMYNFFRQGWVVGRLVKMAEKVFGSRPIVFSLPYQETIPERQQGITSRCWSGSRLERHGSIRAKFREQGLFWINPMPWINER